MVPTVIAASDVDWSEVHAVRLLGVALAALLLLWAIRAGVDYLVVGRPITAADDTRGAAETIVDEIAGAAEE